MMNAWMPRLATTSAAARWAVTATKRSAVVSNTTPKSMTAIAMMKTESRRLVVLGSTNHGVLRWSSNSYTANVYTAEQRYASIPGTEVVPKPEKLDDLGSVDSGYYTDRVDKVAEPERRAFTYLLLSAPHFFYASFARFLVVKFVASVGLAADTLAMAFSEFEVGDMEYGKSLTVTWRGKPLFIRRRTPEEIETERNVPMEHLRDPELDDDRVINPEFVVVLAICPHLGCVPVADAGDYGGYFCPCHGSHYDTVGRIRAGPAPLNLEVPPYKFLDDNMIQVG